MTRQATKELITAVDVIVRNWLRQAVKSGWPLRDRFLVLALLKALVEETPFFSEKGGPGIGRREPHALAAARMALIAGEPVTLKRAMMDAERELVKAALKRTRGRQVDAASLLGITERSMWHRVKKLGIRVEAYKK